MIEVLTVGIRPTSAFRIGDGGETLNFYVCQTRTTKAAKQFLSKALNRSPHPGLR
ncbi:hypothetical protein [Aureimonas ureilytica]|uniref:hypothetical protein n=1 Tax=Aureimonas ureilytica TaxID=401562 RepID=UPI000A65DB5A|nr:hypothetical protein [Aureimonas ureilytica]